MPAGLPDVDTLTRQFKDSLAAGELLDAYMFLETNVQKNLGKFDIEQALQALTDLTEQPSGLSAYFYEKPKKGTLEFVPAFLELKKYLKEFVRIKCQEAGDISYLKPMLQSFGVTTSGIDIFTLNYDPTIETVCEVENVSYTDGFDPYWNPQLLQEDRFQVRLHKVHGSVFWFYRGPGHFVKVPVKGDLKDLRFFTGETLSELLIYPAQEKKLDAGPYPFILNALREKLRSATLLIVIGYGFRDSNVRNLVLEQMRANPDLWMMLVSRSADTRKIALCKEDPDLDTRIVAFNADARIFIGQRELGESIRRLYNIRANEASTRATQANMKALYEYQWADCIRNYRILNHYAKIREIGSELLFSGQYKHQSYQVEIVLFDVALQFGVDEFLRKNRDWASRWFSFFRDCCLVLDEQLLATLPRSSVSEIKARENMEIMLKLPPNEKRSSWSTLLQGANVSVDSLQDDIEYCLGVALGSPLLEPLRSIHALFKTLSFRQGPSEGPNEFAKRKIDATYEAVKALGGFYTAADRLVDLEVPAS